ncbi:MAG: metallophosphoesterase family protein [Pseudomonadota bacterium]
MHFAILTDVHANLGALRAVLQDMDRVAPQVEIFDLGDLLDGGPSPVEVLDLAKSRIHTFIQGNHELYQRDCASNPHWEHRKHKLWQLVPFGVEALGENLLPFLAQQKFSYSPSPGITLLHASLSTSSRVPDFFPEQGGSGFVLPSCHVLRAKQFYFMGHSHHPGVGRDPEGHVWINCGSVGYPFLSSSRPAPMSNWVEVKSLNPIGDTLQLEVTFHLVPYDPETLLLEWIESGALEKGIPFSWAILGQSLFNEDITYPLFRRGKGLTSKKMELFFEQELERLAVKQRILSAIKSPDLASKVSRLV